MSSINQAVLSVLNTEPTSFDAEDDFDPDTEAKIISKKDIDTPTQGFLGRSKKLEFGDDLHGRYAGKTVKRSDIFNDDIDDGDDSSDEENGDEIDVELTEEDGDDEAEDESEDKDTDTEMRDNDNDQDKDNRKIDAQNNEFELRQKEDSDNLAEKAKCTQNQLTIFQEILDYRIRMQHSLTLSNQLGQACDNESRVHDLRKSADKLIKNLLSLKQLLCKKSVTANEDDGEDDDEITSEESDKSDVEDNDLEKETSKTPLPNGQNSKKKRLRLEEDIKQKHTAYKVHRDNILKKWHEKTRLTQISKSNKNEVETSIVDQINYLLKENRTKLIKKIHTKRMDYKVIGENVDNTNDDNIDNEIYDDLDFYNEILREMMQTRTQNITDPILLSKQWAVLNSLRKKVKKHVDTKASKGRRIRYIPHKKLVSFMAPNDYCEYTDEAKNALFQSLFGK